MLDKFNRNISYLRLSVTDLCNLNCKYCSSSNEVKVSHFDLLSNEEMVKVIKVFHNLGIKKVRITGGEPLLKKGLCDLIRQLSTFIDDIGITTNGQLLPDMINDLKDAGLKSINVSLDTLDPIKYQYLTLGKIDNVLKGLEMAYNLHLSIKINAVLLKGVNDEEIFELAKYAKSINAKFRFIELMPFTTTLDYFNKYYISSDEIIKKYNLIYITSNGTSEYYKNAQGLEIGFIRPISHKFCKECNRIRMTSFGKIIPCLHSKDTYDIKEYIDDEKRLEERLIEIINLKPKEHHINEGNIQSLDMRKIGG